jgi:hydroxymethylpyrimidine pyrophosphatase-like HAD family hydrolase
MKSKGPPPPPRVVAIDVDGTLLTEGGQINDRVVEFARAKKSDGFEVWLWSSRGEAHARRAAEMAGLSDVFDHILSKPGYIVDDQGWRWIQYTRVITDPDDL